MAVETRLLSDSISFALTADSWALGRGLLDAQGDPTSTFPAIIGVPNNSTDLGAFNIGIISTNRTIKQALQDLETGVNGRIAAAGNLSELTNKATARSNLELGSSATYNVGTSGATIPVMNAVNTWSAAQTFNAGISSSISMSIGNTAGSEANLFLNTGTSKRWAILRSSAAESGSNAGSNLSIARYSDAGALIANAVSISRATGVVTLEQPLPITSGGTGANSVGGVRTALSINNVDNTSDVNKPISTAVSEALLNKYDKTGGNINGPVNISDNLVASGYLRAGTSLLSAGNDTEGGQLILGYRTYSSITSEQAGTWNVDVNGSNVFRIFARKTNNTLSGDLLTITEDGDTTLQKITVTGNGTVASFRGSGSQNQGIGLRNLFASATQVGDSLFSFENENGTSVGSIGVNIATNGSASMAFGVTPSGARNSDRRSNVFSLSSTEASFIVPINGRAYPRRSDGTNINVIWSGQSGAPTWLIGSNNGTDFYPYSSTSYIRRANNDASSNPSLSSQIIISGDTVTNDVWNSPLQIREVNLVAGAQSASTYAPGVTFHWSSRAASSIKMWSDGSIRFQQQNTTVTYQNIWAADIFTSSWLKPQADTGISWDLRNRQLTVADNGATHGSVNVTGAGLNGFRGYAIGNTAIFMSDGTDSGIYNSTAGVWMLRFDSARNAIFNQNVTAYSDERLKHNKRPIDNVEKRREGMAKAAIIYERDGQTHIGFGAQTLEEYVPEVVNTTDDLLSTKTVSYSDTIAILAADNQLQAEKIVRLENTIADLVARLEKAGL